MRRLLPAIAFLVWPLAASAATTLDVTCAQARQTVARAGGVVLYTGPHLYDRYVADQRFCAVTQTTKPAFIPTRDTPACPVGNTCIEREQEHDRDHH